MGIKKSWIVLMCALVILAASHLTYSQGLPLSHSQQLWESLISAKGGRDRLHSVETLVASTGTKNPYDKREFQSSLIINFFAFPNRWWRWIDQRPGFVLGVDQYDFGREVIYHLSEGSRPFEVRPFHESAVGDANTEREAKIGKQYLSERENFFETQLIYMLETKWFQPSVVGSRRVRDGSRNVDVVEVAVGRETVHYYIDPKSHLPYKMIFRTLLEETGHQYEDMLLLEGYTEVGGIKFPETIKRGGKTQSKTTYEVNVEYDQSLFAGPPRIEAGPDAWRLSKTK